MNNYIDYFQFTQYMLNNKQKQIDKNNNNKTTNNNVNPNVNKYFM